MLPELGLLVLILALLLAGAQAVLPLLGTQLGRPRLVALARPLAAGQFLFTTLSFAALVLSGCMDGVSVIVRSTILQLKTPDALRGRVMSVSSMFINSSNELGQFESGVMAKLMGTVPSVIFGGCMTIAVVVTTWFKAPSLRKMEY